MEKNSRLYERARLGKEISDVVAPMLSKYNLRKNTLAQIFRPAIGLAESSTNAFISSVERGYTNQYFPVEDIPHDGYDRLSKFFYFIRLPKDHEIIGKIQKMYNHFQYPPKNTSQLPVLAELDENYL